MHALARWGRDDTELARRERSGHPELLGLRPQSRNDSWNVARTVIGLMRQNSWSSRWRIPTACGRDEICGGIDRLPGLVYGTARVRRHSVVDGSHVDVPSEKVLERLSENSVSCAP
jgi:hypothetical protein